MSTEDFIQFTPVLFEIAEWLKKRHKPIRPELSAKQRTELKECFHLIDADGSGAITAEELTDAFQFMNVPVSSEDLQRILAEVDRDGSGEVEYDEFVEIMTSSLQNLDVGQAKSKKHPGRSGVLLPFAILATAYRRKRLLDGTIQNDKELRASLVEQAGENGMETMHFTASDYSREEMQMQLQKDLELDPIKTPKSQPSSPEPGAKGFFKTQDDGDYDDSKESEVLERRNREAEEREQRFTDRLMQGRYPYMHPPKPQRLEPPGRRRAVSMARARMKTLSPIRSKSQEPEMNFLQNNRLRSYDFHKCQGGPVACPTSRPIKPPNFCRRPLPKMHKNDSLHAPSPSSHTPDPVPPTVNTGTSVRSYTTRKAHQYDVSPQIRMDVPDIAMTSNPSPSPIMPSGLLTQQKFTPSAILGSPSSHMTPSRSQSGRHLFGPLGQDPVTEFVELDVIGTTPIMNSFDMMLTRPTYRSRSGRNGHRSFSASPSFRNNRKTCTHSPNEGIREMNSLLE